MVNHIYPSELQLNNANVSDTEDLFLDLNLSISDGFVSDKDIHIIKFVRRFQNFIGGILT